MKTKVAVIIPHWNGKEFISTCLASLQKQSLKVHVIVVDNGSSDDSADYIKKNYPKVEVLEFKDNAGFAGGVNRGIKKAMKDGYNYIALFNNDAAADTNWVKNLVDAAERHPEAGVITGKFMRSDKTHIDSTGDFYSIWGMPFPRGRNQKDIGQYDEGGYVFAGSGGASLYKRELFREVGLFDEDFFAYFEDIDISFRAQLVGWKVWYEPTAVAYHDVSATSSKLGSFARYHTCKNFVLVYFKNMPLGLLLLFMPLYLLAKTRLFVASVIIDKDPLVFIKSQLKVLRLLPSLLKKRRSIRRGRSVSYRYVWSILYKKFPPKTRLR